MPWNALSLLVSGKGFMYGIFAVIVVTLLGLVVALAYVTVSREIGRNWLETAVAGVRVFRYTLSLSISMVTIYVAPDAVNLIQQRL
ncbi:hypothetical protein ABZY14_36455 [Streptomyces sp. NPDC006617]|uniref:hypothetical protein n=1 Tax=Streptomyces sp. NPDC006617 TaxID=3155354 RepID=UPI0033BEE75F